VALIKRLSFDDFRAAMDRAGRAEAWSYNGLRALYDLLNDWDLEMGTDTEVDPIAIDCCYTEWESIEEYIDNYGEENCPKHTIESLQDSGVCRVYPFGSSEFITDEH
jgi:hypothetical protein